MENSELPGRNRRSHRSDRTHWINITYRAALLIPRCGVRDPGGPLSPLRDASDLTALMNCSYEVKRLAAAWETCSTKSEATGFPTPMNVIPAAIRPLATIT